MRPRIEHDFYDKDTERKLLASLMIYPEQLAEVSLEASDFYDAAHQLIYSVLRRQFAGTAGAVDVHLLEHAIDESGHLQDVGGTAYLAEIAESSPFPENAGKYAAIVQDLALKRLLYVQTQSLLVDLRSRDPGRVRSPEQLLGQLVATMRQAFSTHRAGQRRSSWTQAELYAQEFVEPRWQVPGLLPVGLAWLAGRPKIGKSWLALQIAHAVGATSDGRFLDVDVSPGRVLYLAYEDSGPRLQKRARQQQIPGTAQIRYETGWPRFAEGGLADLQDAIAAEGLTLAIIDTFSRAAGMADQRDQGRMTMLCGELQRCALDHEMTILVIDHHRKGTGFAPDPVDDIMEATAKGAAPDTIWGLYREPGQHVHTLRTRARDFEERELVIAFDGLTYSWQLQGESGGVLRGTVGEELVEAIRALAGRQILPTTKAIAEHAGRDPGNVSRELARLVDLGVVIRGEKAGRQVPYYTRDTLSDPIQLTQ